MAISLAGGEDQMPIPQFSAGASSGDVAQALGEAGCAVVTGVMDAELRQSIAGELAPHMAKARLIEEDDPTKFYRKRCAYPTWVSV